MLYTNLGVLKIHTFNVLWWYFIVLRIYDQLKRTFCSAVEGNLFRAHIFAILRRKHIMF